MQKFAFILAAGVAAAALASPALADKGPKFGAAAMFEQADTDKNGKVDKAEFEAMRDKRFAALDADKDGAVTRDEMRAARKAWREARRERRRARRIERLDADEDGKLTEADFVARAKARFAGLDGDKDGTVTQEEMAAARKARSDKAGKGARRWHRARFHRGGHRFAGRRMLRRIDADRDGKIGKAEFDHASRVIFTRLDRNGDGLVEPSELRRGGRKAK